MRRASAIARGPAPTGNFQSDLRIICGREPRASTAHNPRPHAWAHLDTAPARGLQAASVSERHG
jgi:hypothetical protein